jgi:hypothetical protein
MFIDYGLSNKPENELYLETEKSLRLIAWVMSEEGSSEGLSKGLQCLFLNHVELRSNWELIAKVSWCSEREVDSSSNFIDKTIQ